MLKNKERPYLCQVEEPSLIYLGYRRTGIRFIKCRPSGENSTFILLTTYHYGLSLDGLFLKGLSDIVVAPTTIKSIVKEVLKQGVVLKKS